MPLASYEIVDKAEDGRLYAVIKLDSGKSFGQLVRPGHPAEIEHQVKQAVDRVEADEAAAAAIATPG